MKKDSRYQKTEKAILASLLKIYRDKPYLASLHPSRLAEHSKISLATFYRHYKTVDDIFIIYERKLTTKFKNMIHRRGKCSIKHLLRLALLFIYKHQEFFIISFNRGDPRLTRQIFEQLRSKIEKTYSWPKNSDKLFDICFYELYGLLHKWGQHAFSEQEISSLLRDISYLLKSAKHRLKEII